MQLRDLFAVPKNQKVTDQHLRRVLTASICSILLCMSCLVGSTWAWFTVSVENTGNVIAVGTPGVDLQVNGQAFVSGSKLTDGAYTVRIEHGNQPDDLNTRSRLYVTMTIRSDSERESVYVILDHENQYLTEFTLNVTGEYSFSWEASWFAPDQADPLTGDTIAVAAESSEPTVETTEDTAETTEPAASNEAADSAEDTVQTP